MAYPREFSMVVFLLLVSLCVYLLLLGRISGLHFVLSMLLSAMSVGILHNLDILHRLALKALGVEATVEIHQIRDQVFAKVQEVQGMGEQIAAMIAWNVAETNRLVGDDFDERLLSQREELRQMLTQLGTGVKEREKIVAPITDVVRRDLFGKVLHEAELAVRARAELSSSQKAAMIDEIGCALKSPGALQTPEALEKLLDDLKVGSPKVERAIRRYRSYLNEDRLPPSEADRQ